MIHAKHKTRIVSGVGMTAVMRGTNQNLEGSVSDMTMTLRRQTEHTTLGVTAENLAILIQMEDSTKQTALAGKEDGGI